MTLEDLGLSESQEVIVLKLPKKGHWDEGDFAEYDDNETTRRYRAEMEAVNNWLRRADIEFDESVMAKDRHVDVRDRRLRRVFTQGRFDSGGRLFGGFWQELKKAERREGLTIQGESVVSLDYSQMTPRILYGRVGGEPPVCDAYTLPGLERNRAGVKKVFNAMVFSSAPLGRMPKGVRQLFPGAVSVQAVTEKILEQHHPIRDLFHRGLGHDLQFTESQVMVSLLLDLMERGVVALPVHDAVVVPWSRKDEVAERMLHAFLTHTGVPGLVQEE